MTADILSTMDPRDLGQRLQRARKQRGLTQADAAALIDVARTTLVAMEQGKRRVKPDELIVLARAFGRPVGEFVRHEAPTESFQAVFRSANLRDLADDSHILVAIDQFETHCRDYLSLEEITNSPLATRHSPQYSLGPPPPEQAGEIIAQQERNRLGLGDGPLLQLRAMLEQDVGLRIFYLPLEPSSTFSAMFCFTAELGGCFVVNGLHPQERRRWFLAHEYAYFLIERHKPNVALDNRYTRRPDVERFADSFALALLMPANGLLRRFTMLRNDKQAFTPGDLCQLANYYAVSVEAITRRLEELKALPNGTWDRVRDSGFRVRDAQLQLGLASKAPYDDRFPKRYQFLAIQALDNGQISEGEFARYLDVDRVKAREIAALLRGDVASPANGIPADLLVEPTGEKAYGD